MKIILKWSRTPPSVLVPGRERQYTKEYPFLPLAPSPNKAISI